MNLVSQIGRYQLPILNVAAIEEIQITGLRKLLAKLGIAKAAYKVTLTNGNSIYFTEDEKKTYDVAMEWHGFVFQVYGFARGMGLRG